MLIRVQKTHASDFIKQKTNQDYSLFIIIYKSIGYKLNLKIKIPF